VGGVALEPIVIRRLRHTLATYVGVRLIDLPLWVLALAALAQVPRALAWRLLVRPAIRRRLRARLTRR
jgi:hypothetical protein